MHWNDEPRRYPLGRQACDELLQTLDFVTATYVHTAREAPRMSREFTPSAGFFNGIDFPKGRHWLWLCSSKAGPNFKWVPASVQLRHDGFAVPVTAREDANARVHFPQELCNGTTDLGYVEIKAILAQMGHPAEVAEEMLQRVKGSFRNSFNAYDGFIDALVVLLFGVEAGRHCSTCATTLMLLELVAGKYPHADGSSKPFMLADAFDHESGQRPMATVHEESSILWHWLDFTELLGDYNQLSVKGRILKLLRTYLG